MARKKKDKEEPGVLTETLTQDAPASEPAAPASDITTIQEAQQATEDAGAKIITEEEAAQMEDTEEEHNAKYPDSRTEAEIFQDALPDPEPNPVWAERAAGQWELMPALPYLVWDAMGQARLYPERPKRDEGDPDGDWYTELNDFEAFPALDVMPDFAEENDWRTSMLKRPVINACPFEPEPQAPAPEAPAPENREPKSEPIKDTAWKQHFRLLTEPGYMERVFASELNLNPERHAGILGSMGCAARAFMKNLLAVPDAYHNKVTPTLKMSTGTEFDLSGDRPKVKMKSRFTVKKEVSAVEECEDPDQPSLPFNATQEQREAAADAEIFGEDPAHGQDELDEEGAPQPEDAGEGEVTEEVVAERDAFANLEGDRTYTKEELEAAGATLKEISENSAEAALRQEGEEIAAMEEADKDAERGVGNDPVETVDAAAEPSTETY